MDSARWQRVESVCFDALELEPSERAAFLRAACANDADLLSEAESLLDQLEKDPEFLERALVDLAALEDDVDLTASPETAAIGPYRLVRRLGRGGMGEVYLAEREAEDTRRLVALKVIRGGRDTREVLRRFRLERRILASLDHPNIAAFLDAGATEDGRPFVAMEYVEGLPLDEYCDQRRLSIRERLALFTVVCRAVQHAHQKLVIHRDLKPRNILITAAGAPKLLDFGIGKVLAPSEATGPTAETGTLVRLLTPEYAAPEQLEGGAITTATDVYGLGLLLYELLSGHHPWFGRGDTRQRLERAVMGETLTRPSEAAGGERTAELRSTSPAQLRRQLSGDLDTIALEALRREPERRYASAAALAEDVQRHLDGLPVSARPDTFGYRARKFVGRHAGWVTAAAVAFVSLGATTVVTLIQSRRIAAESARVTAERDKALEVRSFLMEMFGASGADRAVGDTLSVRRLLDLQAASVSETYGDRPELEAQMMEVLADGYDRLGLYQAAEPLALASLETRRRILPAGHPDLASALNMYGWIQHELGRSTEAEPLLAEAIAIRRAGGPAMQLDLSRSLNDLGSVLTTLARYDDAETVLAESLAIRRAELGDEHRAVGITASNLAAVHYFRGELGPAVELQQIALRALEKAVGPNHQRTIIALGNLAAFRRAGGEWDSTITTYRDLLERQTALQGRAHPVTARVVGSLAVVLYQRGAQLEDTTMLREAEALQRESLTSLERGVGPSNREVGATLARLAGNESALGKHQEALRTAERSLAMLRATAGENHVSTATALTYLAGVHRRAGRLDEALRAQREAVGIFEQTVGSASLETAAAWGALCGLLVERGQLNEGATLCARAAERLADATPAQRQTLPLVQLRLAQTHLARGGRATADSLIAEARGSVEAGVGGAEARRLLQSLSGPR
jgi:serine/threonine protein kinase/tetratricopeptide (TPR) repeat protein